MRRRRRKGTQCDPQNLGARGSPSPGRLGFAISAVLLVCRLAVADPPPSPPEVGEQARETGATGPALEERLRRLEAVHQSILDRLERSERERRASEARYRELERRHEALLRRLEPRIAEERRAPSAPDPGFGLEPDTESGSARSGEGSPRLGSRRSRESAHDPALDSLGSLFEEVSLSGVLGEGFTLRSSDHEYQLGIHVLDQTDFKVFAPNDQIPARSGLYIPRVRVYLEGQLTRLFEYEVSIQRSVEGIWDLLDGNVDIRPDRRFRVRFGRMLVPYSYDWYDHLEQFFITPERALFPLNFGLSRSAGLEAHGQLFDGRLQYAAGGFDGRLVGVADDNTTRDAVAYLNLKPFLLSNRFPSLRHLNVGVSGFLGQQVAPQAPLPLRTSIQSSENDEAARAASSVFLEFFDDVVAFGGRSGSAVHLAWYARGLSLEAEWQGGRQHYLRPPSRSLVAVPASGMHLTTSYFLTGEVVSGRGYVDPLRPFDPARGRWGPGAVELFARFSRLELGESVFSGGLSNPVEWTRELGLVDLGLNWYLTRYLKIYFDWQHSSYATPVLLNPFQDRFSRSNNLFWIRGQLYF